MNSITLSRLILTSVLITSSLTTPLLAQTDPKKKTTTAEAINTLDEKGLPPIWLQGSPVKKFEKDHVYIFEFWATWCAPCIAQMPHIEALHQKFKNDKAVTIIGVNVMDNTPVEKLRKFIKSKKITYTIATDGSRNGIVNKTWLKPLDIRGIPHTIVVRNGKILWAGHPAKLNKELITLFKKPTYSDAQQKKLADEHNRQQELTRSEFFALRDKLTKVKIEPALALLAEYSKKPNTPENYQIKAYWHLFNHHLKNGTGADAQKALTALAENHSNNAFALSNVATGIICTDDLENKDLPLAIRCLEKCTSLNPSKAELYYKHIADAKLMLGDRKGAIEASEKAIQHSKEYKKIQELKSSLNQ